jgi:cytochrome c biogenesis protein CcmG/thiol:disulfide interchange protein DsbE
VSRGLLVAVIVASAALAALLIYGVASQGTDTSIDDRLRAGERVPAALASLPLLGAPGEGSLADHRGKIVVLNFWASWCPPCVEELPLLARTHRRIRRRDATVLGVNYKDLPEDASDFARRFRLRYRSLRDRDGEYGQRYGLTGLPETFLIDRRGRIAALRRGPVTQQWLDGQLAPLLQEGR